MTQGNAKQKSPDIIQSFLAGASVRVFTQQRRLYSMTQTNANDEELDKILNSFGQWMTDIVTESLKAERVLERVLGISEQSMPPTEAKAAIQSLLPRRVKVDGNTSDGYHTFNELYEFRMLYNAALFNEWRGRKSVLRFDVHKSWKHSDGELCFGGGWFVVVAELPTGQITDHYESKYWHMFRIPERDRAAKWDGHTPRDVAKRLRESLLAELSQRGKLAGKG